MASAGSGAIRAGRAYVELLIADKTDKGLAGARRRLDQFGRSFAIAGLKMAGVGAAVAAPLAAAVRTFTSTGDALAKLRDRTGISVEGLSELVHAAGQSDASMDDLGRGLVGMTKYLRAVEQGSQEAVDVLGELGMTTEYLKGKNPDQLFMAFADAIGRVENPTQRSALAMKVFGKSGFSLLPMFAQGAAGIEQLREEARRLGLVMSNDDAEAAVELGDRLANLWSTIKMTSVAIGAALAPRLISLTKIAQGVLTWLLAWIDRNRTLVVTLGAAAAALAGVGSSLVAVGGGLMLTNKVIGATAVATRGLSVAFGVLAANPMALVFAGVAAAAIAAGVAIRQMTQYTAELGEIQSEARAAGDRQRAQDSLAMTRLMQLAEKQRLSNDEAKEASSLITTLENQYGALGLSVDAAAGKILGMAGAQDRLNAAMKEAAIAQIDAEIIELENNVKEARREMDAATGFWANTIFGAGGEGAVREANDKLRAEMAKLLAIRQRRAALLGGDAAAITGEAKDPAAELAARVAEGAAEAQAANNTVDPKQALERWNQIEEDLAAKRRTRHEQELHDIRKLAEERLDLLDIMSQSAREAGDYKRLDELASKWEQVFVDERRAIAEAEARLAARESQKSRNPLGDFTNEFHRPDFGALLPGRHSVAGTFSAAAAARLGHAGGPAEKLVRQGEKQIRLLEDIDDGIGELGEEFG